MRLYLVSVTSTLSSTQRLKCSAPPGQWLMAIRLGKTRRNIRLTVDSQHLTLMKLPRALRVSLTMHRSAHFCLPSESRRWLLRYLAISWNP